MNDVIKNLYTLFNKAWEENNNGRGTEITKMATTFVPKAIQNLQAYEDLEVEDRLMTLPCKIGDTIYQIRYKCICTAGHAYLHNTCHKPIDCTICPDVKVECSIVKSTFSIDKLDNIGEDFFVTYEDSRIVFNEINTLPGFTSISMYPKLFAASGIPYTQLIDHLLELAQEACE